jgi:hypothetical protein
MYSTWSKGHPFVISLATPSTVETHSSVIPTCKQMYYKSQVKKKIGKCMWVLLILQIPSALKDSGVCYKLRGQLTYDRNRAV